jgi:Protein of unknown function (DUF4233)
VRSAETWTRADPVRTLCSAVLGFEALVVALAIAPALALTQQHHAAVLGGGLAVVALCVLAAALLGSAVGYVLGSVAQVLVVAAGSVLPAMYFLGSIFAALWLAAVVVARRAEQVRLARAGAAGRAQPGPG